MEEESVILIDTIDFTKLYQDDITVLVYLYDKKTEVIFTSYKTYNVLVLELHSHCCHSTLDLIF